MSAPAAAARLPRRRAQPASRSFQAPPSPASRPVSAGSAITGVKVAAYRAGQGRVVNESKLACDFVAMSGGFNPAVHLWCHNGGKLAFDEALQSFQPGKHHDADPRRRCRQWHVRIWRAACAEGYAAGECRGEAHARHKSAKPSPPRPKQRRRSPLEPIWFSPATGKYNEGNKHFIDFQNDVTAADLELAQREGYESVEHTKRYTTFGMATDQGKTSNINGLGRAGGSDRQDDSRNRHHHLPAALHAVLLRLDRGLADRQPVPARSGARRSIDWHKAQGAVFEPVGQWRRAYTYPRAGEDKHAAINREILGVRNKVGLLDASTLGKIEIKGPDAAEFLDRVYTNMFSTLKVGRCRYGLMMNELGFLIDDGVTVRLAR